MDLSNLFAGIWMEDNNDTATVEAGELTQSQVPCRILPHSPQ